jgi:hypothetical protein
MSAAAALAKPIVEDSTKVFGASHSQTLLARLWGLAARGYAEGPEATRGEFDRLRADVMAAKGAQSPILPQLEGTWRGVAEGIEHGLWWK